MKQISRTRLAIVRQAIDCFAANRTPNIEENAVYVLKVISRRPSKFVRFSCGFFLPPVAALILIACSLAFVVSSQAANPISKIKRVLTKDSTAEKMSREECIERAKSTRINKDLQGATLNDADLSNTVLLSANLRGANLKKTIFTKATMCRADLSGAVLEGAVLNDADLSGAKLVNAKLKGANLTNAKLCNAMLMGADLTGAILVGTDLAGANMQGATLSKTNQLDQAVLSQTILPDGSVHP